MSHMNRRKLRAFTLVELLVVIGIIALLISILLPSLAKARESAKNVKCLSNLHQIGIALQIYANDNKDQVPIGCSDNYPGSGTQWWAGYWMTDYGAYGMWGNLYAAKLMTEPRAFFCPSQTDVRFVYDDPQNNPWPTDPTWTSLSSRTRAGYQFRPSVAWRFISGSPSTATPMSSLVRLSIELGKKAVVSDIVGIPGTSVALTSVHRGRPSAAVPSDPTQYVVNASAHINVLYGDRSARSVDSRSYEPTQAVLSTLSTSAVSGSARGTYYDYGTLGHNTIWDNFDSYNR